jgi:hypothetical protein
MLAYVVLAVVAITALTATVTVSGQKMPIGAVTLVILAMFALRTWLHHKREALDKFEKHDGGQP